LNADETELGQGTVANSEPDSKVLSVQIGSETIHPSDHFHVLVLTISSDLSVANMSLMLACHL